ncbi:uncharacterized protein LOC131288591 [Anopheles ziemanni]|uniref:uncharacterized protein LOC131259397 n=1 Tax=Anopheles coustani TaxID=139045 RepID=UPI0026581AE2|nr:uncharacterized protein LOC131259397 [Anopheles coustani]XP_058173722.1 uncharacterized protein LOC131288591 [Anopheles ziemanni]
MSGHGRSVFVNSCIKKPLSPSSKRPNPSFLVPQCSLDRGLQDPRTQDAMSTMTRKKAASKCPLARNGHYRRSKCCSMTHQLRKEADSFQTMVQFYDSIPDYNELLHLPRDEFYCRLNTLKKKQRELKSMCCVGEADVNGKGDRAMQPEVNDGCTGRSEVQGLTKHSYGGVSDSVGTGDPARENVRPNDEDGDSSLHSWSKSPPTVVDTTNDFSRNPTLARKGSAKSVRIESTKEDNLNGTGGDGGGRKYRSGTPFASEPDDSGTTSKNVTPTCATPINADFVERYDRYVKRNLRCKSASPIRNLANVTIPQPYKMTQREEEQRTLQELLLTSKSAFPSREALPEPASSSTAKPATQFRAHPVPITSRIPLFDTIMADQEYRNRLAKLNSEIELQSQIKPFHFSERLNRGNSRCLSRSLSSPALLGTGLELGLDGPAKVRPFKAKPCPKKLFSSSFQTKAWEEEYFRFLNKRLRAEEMLRQATLPPSMARRERSERKNCLSRHSVTTDETTKDRPGSAGGGKKSKRKRKTRKSFKRRKSVEEKCADYFASVTDPSRILYPTSNSSCSNSTDPNRGSGDTPAPIYPVNRPNLAATLRTEWCRKKLRDLELDETAAEKKKAPRFRWGVKKSQAFQNLNLDHTHEEELNLRLATRRAEQRLRQEEHAINMELMRQRVKAAPLLLEGPPQWGPRLGHVAHRCSSLNRESEQALFRKPEKFTKSISQKLPTAAPISGPPAGPSKKCDSPVTSYTNTSTSSHHRGRPGRHEQRHQRSAEKRRNAGNGSKLSTYSFDSTGKQSYKVCDSELLSLSDV